ncbi:MAG: serine/threonine-protein kinase [Deltaproteobacteria bacterium]|nr:serine/threonine-protein kinase [Deltaproteobacteria bacterium]
MSKADTSARGGRPDRLLLARVADGSVAGRLCSIVAEEAGIDGLPEELHVETLQRLKALVAVLGILHVVPLAVESYHWWGGRSADLATVAAVLGHGAGLVMAASFLMLLLACRMGLGRALDLALAFQVVTSFAFASTERAHRPGAISVVAIVILVFALFVPRNPRKTMVAAFSSALTVPPAHLLVESTEQGATGWLFPLAVNLAVAAIAIVPATVVSSLAKALDSARRMGSYELVEKIGAGGMGEVWRAHHRMLRRPAAVKIVKPAAARDAVALTRARLRFEREAQVIAELESEHTVRIFDFGATSDGGLFYVMELLSGLDLESLVRTHGPMPPERVVYLMAQACDSLADAHLHGVIHRDVKPANIFVARTSTMADFIKVLDFGVAASVTEGQAGVTLTAENAVVGSPAFLAPEMVLGAERPDPRSDVYAIGCVMYFLLAGNTVFQAASAMEMAIAHVNKEPGRASALAPGPVPVWLDDLIAECLRKHPAARPRDMQELRQRLLQEHLPNPWTEERARGWWVAHGKRAGAKQSPRRVAV